ncbi:MAG: hypothetical protein ACO1OB_25020 [Archangium sp.]
MRWALPVLTLLSCARPSQPAREPSHPDLTLRNVTVRAWGGNGLRVVTTADSLWLSREGGAAGTLSARDAGITVIRDGVHVTAPLVTGNFLAGDVEGQGGVTLTAPNELRGESPRVAYSRSLGLASSDAGVVVTQPGMRLDATGFTANVPEQSAEFDNADTRFTAK